jgi:hypothetical protein
MSGFTQADSKIINDFFTALKMGLKVENIGTNNAENDTIDLCDYTIIKDDKGTLHVDRITVTGGYHTPPEQAETPVGEYFSLPLALTGIAQDVTLKQASIFFEDLFCASIEA